MLGPARQLGRLSIGKVVLAVAVCAVGLAAPETLVFAVAVGSGVLLGLGAIFTRTGRRVAGWCVVAASVVSLVAIGRFSTVTNCYPHRRAEPIKPVLRRLPSHVAPSVKMTIPLGDTVR